VECDRNIVVFWLSWMNKAYTHDCPLLQIKVLLCWHPESVVVCVCRQRMPCVLSDLRFWWMPQDNPCEMLKQFDTRHLNFLDAAFFFIFFFNKFFKLAFLIMLTYWKIDQVFIEKKNCCIGKKEIHSGICVVDQKLGFFLYLGENVVNWLQKTKKETLYSV